MALLSVWIGYDDFESPDLGRFLGRKLCERRFIAALGASFDCFFAEARPKFIGDCVLLATDNRGDKVYAEHASLMRASTVLLILCWRVRD